MDRLSIGQRHHAQDSQCVVASARYLTPEANAAVRLHVATKGRGNDGHAPRRIDIGSLASPVPLNDLGDSVGTV